MYLEERVVILEDMLYRMINAHPELCPHTFEKVNETINLDNTITVRYKCRMCGAEELQTHEVEKPLGYFTF